MEPMISNDDVAVLAQAMIKHFPSDAADQAALRSSAFFAMGYVENSTKWLLVRAEIKKILADAKHRRWGAIRCTRRKLSAIPSGFLASH